jgi:cellulose synthase/poly-beta-1,6-N-acetylglucosamine synthase-like glycosyltransferase
MIVIYFFLLFLTFLMLYTQSIFISSMSFFGICVILHTTIFNKQDDYDEYRQLSHRFDDISHDDDDIDDFSFFVA